MRSTIVVAGALALSACSATDLEPYTYDSLTTETRRAFAAAYQDQPFTDGTVYVLAEEHGDLHTYSLTPCGGHHVCGGSGRVGHVERLADYYKVTGAYPHRIFYLSPGGDGYLTWRGVDRDLAWD